jgi:ABC-type Fe3+-siderophore transport system permease subunit
MTLTKALIISATLFIIGIILQGLTEYPATSLRNMEINDYIYASFYIAGISFVPLYGAISKPFSKKKNIKKL